MPEPQTELDPNQLGPTPDSAATATPDFSQHFAQTIMQQFLQNTPEEILRKKREEYFRNLGIKNPQSALGSLGGALNEAHLKNIATKENPYKPLNERLTNSAQSEFERLSPNLRLEAGQVLKDQQEQAKVRQAAEAAKLKSKTDIEKSQNQLKWQMDRTLAQSNNQDAKNRVLAEKQRIETQKYEQLNKIYPGFSALPKEMQERVFVNTLDPEEKQKYLEATDALTTAKAAPSVQKQLDLSLKPGNNFPGYLENYKKIKEADKLSKYPPGTGGGSFRIFQGMEKDPVTGDLVQQNSFYDPKNPTAPMIPIQQHPLNNKLIDTDRALKLSEGNYQSAFNIMLDAIQTGKDEEFQGYSAGNPLATKFRALGALGDGKTSSEASMSAVKNVADMLHARGLTGGGRFPLQLAERLAAASGSQSDSSRSVARAMAALVYAVQDSRKMATDPTYSARQMTPAVQRRIEQEIDKAVDRAFLDKKMGTRSNIQLPSLDSIIKTVNTVYPPKQANPSKQKFLNEVLK